MILKLNQGVLYRLGLSVGIVLAYLALSYIVIGFKTDQLYLSALFFLCFNAHEVSRKLIIGFSIFIIYWIVFDYMKAFPNYNYNEVRIESLYLFEKQLFGFNYEGQLITPNEFFALHSKTFWDVACGFFYLTWIPIPLGFAMYLFFKNKSLFVDFSATFLLVNLIGFVVYYIYPAAPPWYVQQFGFEFNPNTQGNTAGLSRFDAFFGIPVFKSLYEKSSNVFAAMPSLHSSYPVIVFYYGLKNKLGKINILFFISMVGIWFSAVYSSHHYVLDVLFGILTACVGISLYNFFNNRKGTLIFFKQKMFLYIK
jgi:hypothetical protein